MTGQPTTTAQATVKPIKRASRASRAAGKTATTNCGATKTPAKPTPAKTAAAKSAPAKTAKPLTTTAEKHIVADAMVLVCAKLAADWNPKSHAGVSRETATHLIASWVNYVPLTTWDTRLGERPGAGGRGAKARKST